MPPALSRKLPLYLLMSILVFGGALRMYYFGPGIARTPDERTYTRQANIILDQGIAGGCRFLGEELDQDIPAVSRYPSPMRVGYILPLAGWMRLTGDRTVLAGAYLSLLFSLATLCLIAFCAYRYLSPLAALVATLFYAVFPFDLTIFRRTWEESFMSLLTIAVLALAVYIARTTGSCQYRGLEGFSLLGLLAMTTKENSGLVFLLCGAGLVLHFILQRDRRAALLTASSVAIAVVAYALLLGLLFGGVVHALTLVRGYAHYSGVNPYSVQFDSGPAWLLPQGLFLASPFTFLAALAGFAAALYPVLRRCSLAGLPAGVAALTACMLLIQLIAHRYSFRYMAPIYAPLCLLAGIGTAALLPALHRLIAPLGRLTAWSILGFAIAVAAYRDLSFTQERFLGPEIPDLVIRPILGLPPAPVPPDYPR